MKRFVTFALALVFGFVFVKAQDLPQSPARGELRIAVFGGSLSVFPESRVAKAMWEEKLGAKVTDFGVGGAGFSKLQGRSLQGQVDQAVEPFDIYILWASTNDYTHSRPCGDPMDYTKYDDFDEAKLDTQCGGINYCIKTIRDHNPDALIVFFTSLPFFKDLDTNDLGLTFEQYVDAQLVTCALQNIPVLHQFGLGIFTQDNYQAFYHPDRLHLKESGYAVIGPIQAEWHSGHVAARAL